MESDKAGPGSSPGPDIEVIRRGRKATAMTVTELMDQIERTALKRYFDDREFYMRSYNAKLAPSSS